MLTILANLQGGMGVSATAPPGDYVTHSMDPARFVEPGTNPGLPRLRFYGASSSDNDDTDFNA